MTNYKDTQPVSPGTLRRKTVPQWSANWVDIYYDNDPSVLDVPDRDSIVRDYGFVVDGGELFSELAYCTLVYRGNLDGFDLGWTSAYVLSRGEGVEGKLPAIAQLGERGFIRVMKPYLFEEFLKAVDSGEVRDLCEQIWNRKPSDTGTSTDTFYPGPVLELLAKARKEKKDLVFMKGRRINLDDDELECALEDDS
jgi:hypothetical protein